MFVSVLGWAAAAIGAAFMLPQVVRLLRSRSTAGVSTAAWQIMLGANLGWTGHGLLSGHANIWLPNTLLLVCTLVILTTIHRQAGTPWVQLLAPGLALATTMLVLNLTLGPVAFAVAAFIPSGCAQVLQLKELVHSVNLSGVSVGYLGLSVVNQVLWLSWSLLAGEISVTLCAMSLGTLMTINLVWALLRRYRVVTATLASF
jgi:uncharacterized protein with PQ loop repeat